MKAFSALVLLAIVASTHAFSRSVKDKPNQHVLDSKCIFEEKFVEAKVTVPTEYKIEYLDIDTEKHTISTKLESADETVKKAVRQFFGLLDDINNVGIEHILAIDEFLEWGADKDVTDFFKSNEITTLTDSLNLENFRLKLSEARFNPSIIYSEASVLRAAERVEKVLETLLEVEYYHVSIVVPAIDTNIHWDKMPTFDNLSGCHFEKVGETIKSLETASGVPLPNCSLSALVMFRDIHEHLNKIHQTYTKDKHSQGAAELFKNLLDIFSTGEVIVNWDVEEEFAASRYTLYDELHQVTRYLDGFMEIIEEALEKLRQTGIAGFSIMKVTHGTPLSMVLETSKTEIEAAEISQDMDNDLKLIADLSHNVLFITVAKPKDSKDPHFHSNKAKLHTDFKKDNKYKTYHKQTHPDSGTTAHKPTENHQKHSAHTAKSKARKAKHIK